MGNIKNRRRQSGTSNRRQEHHPKVSKNDIDMDGATYSSLLMKSYFLLVKEEKERIPDPMPQ